MWLLPLDFGDTRSNLPPGRYLLPWYDRADSVGRLSSLLCRLLVGISHRLHLPWESLPLGEGAMLRNPEHVLVVVCAPPGTTAAEMDERVSRLGGRYQLVQYTEPQETGYGWQEQYVQEPIISVIRRNIGHPEHPLAELGIEQLPLNFAARLTTDTIELLDLLGDATAHRLTYASHGTGRDDWRQSVRVVAGRRLARRVMQLTAEDRAPALAVLLAGPAHLTEVGNWRQGAAALQHIGLAWLAAGDVSLGPLARALRDVRIRGAFFDALPPEVWTPSLRRWRIEIDAEVAAPARMQRAASSSPARSSRQRSGDRLWSEVVAALREALRQEPDEARSLEDGVEVLEAVGAVPGYFVELPDALAQRTIRALRTIEQLKPDHPGVFRLKKLVYGLLQFQAMRGPERGEARERAWAALSREITADDPVAFALGLGAATAELAWDLVNGATERAHLERAEAVSRAALALTPPRSAAAASLLGVLAHLHAARGETDTALTLHHQRLATYDALGALREQAVTQARIARIKEARGELEEALAMHRQALAVFEAIGAEHDYAVTQGDIARILTMRGQDEEAYALHQARLRTFERLGALHSRAIAMGDVARILASRGELDEALALHQRRHAEFEALGEPQACAIALGDIARIRSARGELDEALSIHRKRLRTFEALDDMDGLAITHLNIGQVEVERGHLSSAVVELRAALNLNRQLGHVEGIAMSAETLGRALQRLGDPTAGAVLADAIDAWRQLGREERVAELRRLAGE